MAKTLSVKFILPSLTEAENRFWHPIKYSLFPPLGLATLTAYLQPDDEARIVDQHVEPLRLNDQPDLVVIQVYITNAYRAYKIADHYRKQAIYDASRRHSVLNHAIRHFAYASTWKKFEPMWNFVITNRVLSGMRPLLEKLLTTRIPNTPWGQKDLIPERGLRNEL